jgi:hypothetical protein
MREDIREAKASADVVIVMMHWGVHFVPAVLAEYQREAAHAAIDAGADLIAGHHPHLLKGVEVYRGKVVLYSLGNFALDPPTAFQENVFESEGFRDIQALNPGFGSSGRSFLPPETRKTVIAKCVIQDRSIREVFLLPAHINERAEPKMLDGADRRYDDTVRYLEAITASEGLNATFHMADSGHIRIGDSTGAD